MPNEFHSVLFAILNIYRNGGRLNTRKADIFVRFPTKLSFNFVQNIISLILMMIALPRFGLDGVGDKAAFMGQVVQSEEIIIRCTRS